MKFSICIPNYNYARYIDRTIRSVLEQSYQDFEIVIADNASTDRSVDVIRSSGDPRIQLHVNACNVGFGGNLDRAGRMATGDFMIMLSSDDLIRPGALEKYHAFLDALGSQRKRAITSATFDVIDSDDHLTGERRPDPELWHEADRQPQLEAVVEAPVYGVAAHEMLRRCLRTMKNPFNFAATVYPQELYAAVEGYGGGRQNNPDKWFHWKVLGVAKMAYFIDRNLFAYRWHSSNQAAQEGAASSVKFLVDEYVSTLELDAGVLARVGMSRDDVVRAFVEHTIAGHGLATLAQGQRVRARRILDFGRAAYPQFVRKSRRARALKTLLAMGPVGEKMAGLAYRRYSSRVSGPRENSKNA